MPEGISELPDGPRADARQPADFGDAKQGTQTPASLPEEGKKWKILAGVLAMAVFAAALFTAYKLGQIQEKRQEVQDRTEQIESIQCRQDEDCIIAIRLDQCCSCPTAVSREAVQKDKNLVEYEFGKDYSKEKNIDCGRVLCKMCVFWKRAICESGKCKGISKEVEPNLPTADWENFIYEGGFSIKYPPNSQIDHLRRGPGLYKFIFADGTGMVIDGPLTVNKELYSDLHVENIADWVDYYTRDYKGKKETVLVGDYEGVKFTTEDPDALLYFFITPTENNKAEIVFISKDLREFFQISYFAPPSLFEEGKSTFNLILLTLRFLPSASPSATSSGPSGSDQGE